MSIEHNEHKEALAAYVLGALDADEVLTFEQVASSCFSCQQELEQFGETVAMLALAADQIDAPSNIKSELMETVRADTARSRVEVKHRASRFRQKRLVLAVGLASLAAFAVTGIVISESNSGSGTKEIVASVNHRTISGSARLVIRSKTKRATLKLDRVSQPPSGKTYQLWTENEGQIEPGPTFRVDADGNAAVDIDKREVETVMVTREPVGGSANPTETPVITVSI